MSSPKHLNVLPGGYQLLWYRIESVLGRGGFGITYLATDTNLERKVAIKEYFPTELSARTQDLSVHAISDDQADTYEAGLKRFLTEARTLAKFDHRNVVRVHNVFAYNQTAYMAMEYEHGESLDTLLRLRKIKGEDKITGILYPLLDALEYIHQLGFIHRDIKPSNIFIRQNGMPVLLDFGSTRIALSAQNNTMTRFVSRGYAPYEQYGSESGEQGQWTDIYAMGATLYAVIAGRPPIDAITRANARLQGKDDPLAPAQVIGANAHSPQFLRAIDKAMNVMPEDRPPSISAWRKIFKTPTRPNPKLASPALSPRANDRSQQADFELPHITHGESVLSLPTALRFKSGMASSWSSHLPLPTTSIKRAAIWAILILLLVLELLFIASRSTLFTPENGDENPISQDVTALKDEAILPSIDSENDDQNIEREKPAPVETIESKIPKEKKKKKPTSTDSNFFQDRLTDGGMAPKMAIIPAGRFRKGYIQGLESGSIVSIDTAFAMGRYEVTFAEYERFANATHNRLPKDMGWGRGERPVIYVSWYDAVNYAEWLSEQTGKNYRLPTDTEWEFAAKARTATMYWWGTQIGENLANCEQCGSEWDDRMTAPVGSFSPNPFGLYDTAGNVWEWIQECNWRSKELLQDNPLAASECRERVFRGGAWNTKPYNLRSTKRNGDGPDLGYRYVGFRVARDMDEPR